MTKNMQSYSESINLDADQVQHLDSNVSKCYQQTINVVTSRVRVNSFFPFIIFDAFLSSADFFQNQLFRKILSGITSECHTDWVQVRPDFCRA